MRSLTLIILIYGVIFYNSVQAQTIQVSGEIDSDITWQADVVEVTGNVQIARHATVTIPAGTLVEFQGHYGIYVDGAILANGAVGDTIVFTINDPTGFSNKSTTEGSWYGIRFNAGFSGFDNNDTSYFSYCRIEYTKYNTSLSAYMGAAISVIYNYEVVITNSVIENHYSMSCAGGVSSFSSELIIKNNLFRNCEGGKGGAINAVRGVPVVEGNTIISNTADQGGGIYGRETNMKVIDNVFDNNHANLYGGAIYFIGTDGQVSWNEFTYNSCGSYGGAIYYDENASAGITGNFIANNQSAANGGAIYCNASNPALVNNGIFNNTASNSGGGLYLQDFNAILLNNSIANNNAAQKGGAMYTNLSSPDIFNTLIWNNYALQGSQIYVQDAVSELDFRNCDLQGGIEQVFSESGSLTYTYDNCIDKNPQFVSPTAGRGISFNASLANWKLQTYSPCINAGIQEGIPASIPDKDLGGGERIIHVLIDIGAYEKFNDKINICGVFTQNTPLAADSAFITCDVTVNDGVTLTIAPGTVIVIDEETSILVNGTVIAEGTGDHPIIFTVKDTSGFSDQEIFNGGWAGIVFDNESLGGEMYDNDPSRFRFCRFEYVKGKSVIHCIRYSGVEVDQCRFLNNSGSHSGGIYGYFANLTVKNSLFENNRPNDLYPSYEASALHFSYSSPAILNNEFRNNRDDVMYIQYCNGAEIRNNLIANTIIGSGIRIRTSHNSIIEGNRVFNSSYDSYYGGGTGITMFKGNHYLANNLVCNNGSIGISFVECGTSYAINNTICNNNGAGANIYTTDAYAYNNIIHGNSTDITLYGDLNSSNNHLTDAKFRSPTAGRGIAYDASGADWTLIPISPAINQGAAEVPGSALPATDIDGNPRIWNEAVDIGAHENIGSRPVISRQPSNVIACGGDYVMLHVQTEDTAYYQWQKNGQDISGANQSSLVFQNTGTEDQGNYTCMVSNSFGTTESNPAYVFVNLGPEILTQPSDAWLQREKRAQIRIDATGSAPMSYQWQKDGIDIAGANSPELKISSADFIHEGNYSCMITNACGSVHSSEASIYLVPEICMVTVDSATGNNLVVWEKKSIAPISHYNVYRESDYADIYDLLATVPYDDLSVYEDEKVDPVAQAYLYKITATDHSGYETDPDLCEKHKTIHLVVTRKLGSNEPQLEWYRYVGFDYGTYAIYRSDKTTDFSIVHTMASSNISSSWTDLSASNDTLYYIVAAVKTDTCFPSGGNLKAGTGPYQHALSNLGDNKKKATASPAVNQVASSLVVYPNPMSSSARILFHNPTNDDYRLLILDLSGKVCRIKDGITTSEHILEKESLAKGMYLLELRGPNLYRGKIMIE